MGQQILLELDEFIREIFKFEEVKNNTYANKKFVRDMIIGILGSRSTIIANIARFLKEDTLINHTEKRLSRMLGNKHFPREILRERVTDLGVKPVQKNDIIAFDPGDISKKYSKKMDYLYRVHDGSSGEIRLGWEHFCVESIHWSDGEKQHSPLYERLINASCPGYVSQNYQIIEAINAVKSKIGDWCGIWTFDRLHDRNILFKELLKANIWWIVRLKYNRVFRVDGESMVKVEDLIEILSLSKGSYWLLFPKRSGELRVAWRKVRIPKESQELTIVLVHDLRNKDPIIFLTNRPVRDDLSAIEVFAYYLERWGKEEGYRFSKSFLNLEDLRPMKWESIQNMSFMSHLAYLFLTWIYRRHKQLLEMISEKYLKNFEPISEIHYRYYRIGQVIQILLTEALGHGPTALAMTQVG